MARMKKKTAKKAAKKKVAKKTAKKTTKKAAKKMTAKPAKKAKKMAPKKVAAKKPAPKKTMPMALAPSSGVLSVGKKAPSFSVATDAGNTVSLKDFAGKTVVLYFYPKDDTPGCTKESCDFRDSFARVQSAGAVVLGVSKDSVASHKKFKEKFSLPFPLLSDESGKMQTAYNVSSRTTFLIEVDAKGNGKIRKVYPQVKVEGHVDQILKDIAKANA